MVTNSDLLWISRYPTSCKEFLSSARLPLPKQTNKSATNNKRQSIAPRNCHSFCQLHTSASFLKYTTPPTMADFQTNTQPYNLDAARMLHLQDACITINVSRDKHDIGVTSLMHLDRKINLQVLLNNERVKFAYKLYVIRGEPKLTATKVRTVTYQENK
jgi:hypothetical protein